MEIVIDKGGVYAMILLWDLPEAPNSISGTYILNISSFLGHKIHGKNSLLCR